MKTFQTHSGQILIFTGSEVIEGEKMNLRQFWKTISDSDLPRETKFQTLEFLESLSKSTEDGAKGKESQNQRDRNIKLREDTKQVFLKPGQRK